MFRASPFPIAGVCLLLSCAEAAQPGPTGPQGPAGPTGPAGPPGQPASSDPGASIVNGTTAQNASFNITGTAEIGGVVTLHDQVRATSTWGLNARLQGLMIMPEGGVHDDGAGTLTFDSTIIVMNPAAGSYVRVAAGSWALPAWGYLYVDLPPFALRATQLNPQVGAWTDGDRAYDHPDRLVLAQRQAAGAIHVNFRLPVTTVAPSSLVTMVGPNLGDVRNNATVNATATNWWTIPNRQLTFTKRYPSSKLKITYQDTLGTYGQFYDGCEWQIVVDGNAVAFFSDADTDRPDVNWRMSNAAHVAWATAPAGAHTVAVQNRGNRGAWGNGTSECLQGWNTIGNFLSVEEIP